MKEVRIFIRKKTESYQHSIERFSKLLKEVNKNEKFKVKIIECPVSSKGLLNRFYLVLWSYFNQGDVNHILGDINFISIFMKKSRTINLFYRLLFCLSEKRRKSILTILLLSMIDYLKVGL